MRGFNPAVGSGGGKSRNEERGGPHRSVTMASSSRLLTDRPYVMRKPLFSAELHASILRKTHPLESTEKEKSLGVSRSEHVGENFLTRPREEQVTEGFSLSPPTAFREAFTSPMTISELRELREQLCFDEPTSPFPATSSAVQTLSSSNPQRPKAASTVLHPTYAPYSGHFRVQTQVSLEGTKARGGWHSKQNSYCGHESIYQANYWACAIPKTSPPSPDRRSAAWDPNKEYQALLDYTYPLRPGQETRECDRFETQGDPLLHTDSTLQDSGIGLDLLGRSATLPGLELFGSGTGHLKERRHSLIADEMFPDLQGLPRSLGARPSDIFLCPTGPVDLSFDKLGCNEDPSGTNHVKSDDCHHGHQAPSSLPSLAGPHSTSVLPQSKWALDEEFRPLPEHLEVMQLLSRQVKEVTVKVSQPAIGSRDVLQQDATSIVSSITKVDKGEVEAQVEQAGEDEPDKYGGKKERKEQSPTLNDDHRDLSSDGGGVKPGAAALAWSSVREVEALGELLCGLSLPDRQEKSQMEQDHSDSLIHHIQVFCSHLKLLIQELYTLSERLKLLTAPTVDMDSVKASLAEYQSLQREVSSHQPLTTCVLHTGQLLLSCINSTSPLLRDSLLLIDRQSAVLQSHTERFLSSILSTMESLNQPGSIRDRQKDNEGIQGPPL